MARVLLLTEPSEGEDLAFLLGEEGHDAAFLPVLPKAERSAGLRSVAETLQRFTWVIALDRAVLRAFLEVVNQAGTRAQLPRLQWLAADAIMARVIERAGGLARIPAEGKWTAAVSGLLHDEDEVLLLHSSEPIPEVLLDALDAAGTHRLAVEVSVDPLLIEDEAVRDAAAVIVHSASAAEAWAELTHGEEHEPSEACCGPGHTHHDSPPRLAASASLKIIATPAAAESLRERGVTIHSIATDASTTGVVDAALAALSV
ncbi:MAG: hypothetical protein QM817_08525 [Archangium sp.]